MMADQTPGPAPATGTPAPAAGTSGPAAAPPSPGATPAPAAETTTSLLELPTYTTLQRWSNYGGFVGSLAVIIIGIAKQRSSAPAAAPAPGPVNIQMQPLLGPNAGGNPGGNIGGNALGNAGGNAAQQAAPPLLRGLAIGFSIPYLAPNIPSALYADAGKGYVVANDVVTGLYFLKTLADNWWLANVPGWQKPLSPVVEFFINLVWIAPAVAAFTSIDPQRRTALDRMGLAGNLCFDVGGLFAPAAELLEPPYSTVAFAATAGLDLAYGSLCLATARKLEGA